MQDRNLKEECSLLWAFAILLRIILVSCYSAIGDTISCDAPYSAIGFRGKLFLRYLPSKACLWIAIVHFYGKKWGCSSDSLRCHRKHSATGVLLHLSCDKGGISVGSLRESLHVWNGYFQKKGITVTAFRVRVVVCFAGTVSLSFLQNAVTEKRSPQEFSRSAAIAVTWFSRFSNLKCNAFEKNDSVNISRWPHQKNFSGNELCNPQEPQW